MTINWKAVLIGATASIALLLVLGAINNLLGLLGVVLGGFVGAWYAKVKDLKEGAKIGMLSGLVGGLIEGILAVILLALVFGYTGNTLGIANIGSDMPIAIGVIAIIGSALVGLVLGLIGGIIGSYFTKKK